MKNSLIPHVLMLFFLGFSCIACREKVNVQKTVTDTTERVDYIEDGALLSDMEGILQQDVTHFINENHKKYLNLLELAERMVIYTHEETIKFAQEEQNTADEDFKIRKEQKKHQLMFAKMMYDKVVDLATGQIDSNHCLFYMLINRLIYLIKRQQLVDEFFAFEKKQTRFIAPTDEALCEWFLQDDFINENRIQHIDHRTSTITRYEMLNLLIKECFSQCKLNDLADITIYLLRASKQLHPILENRQQGLGHPDEACGSYYNLLAPVILAKEGESTNFKALMALKQESLNHLATQQVSDFSMEKNRFLFFKFYVENVKNYQLINRNIRNELKRIQKNIDACIVSDYCPNLLDVIKVSASCHNQMPQETTIQFVFPTLNSNFSLPNPSFLHVVSTYKNQCDDSYISHLTQFNKKATGRKGNRVKAKDKSKVASKHKKHDQRVQKTVSMEVQEAVEKSQHKPMTKPEVVEKSVNKVPLSIVTHHNEVSEQPKLSIAHLAKGKENIKDEESELANVDTTSSATMDKNQSINNDELGFPLKNQKPIPLAQVKSKKVSKQESKLKKRANKSVATNASKSTQLPPQHPWEPAFSFRTDWNLPRGLRLSHQHMLFVETYPVHRAANQHQEIVNRLFCPSQWMNVTFAQFESLWKSEKGKIQSGSGGSHKELIGPRNEKLFGIWAHGNNQTYGSNYIKYLQTAVLYIGLKPIV